MLRGSACPVCITCRVMHGQALLLDSLRPGHAGGRRQDCQRGTLSQCTMRDLPSIVIFILQVAAQAEDTDSYWCHDLRAMPAASIDPSLAVGFLCQSRGKCACAFAAHATRPSSRLLQCCPADDAQDLCHRLKQLEMSSGGAPLLSVAEGSAPDWEAQEKISEPSNSNEGGDWELL